MEGLAELGQRLGENDVERIAAISIASIGESFIGLSSEGEPLTPSI